MLIYIVQVLVVDVVLFAAFALVIFPASVPLHSLAFSYEHRYRHRYRYSYSYANLILKQQQGLPSPSLVRRARRRLGFDDDDDDDESRHNLEQQQILQLQPQPQPQPEIIDWAWKSFRFADPNQDKLRATLRIEDERYDMDVLEAIAILALDTDDALLKSCKYLAMDACGDNEGSIELLSRALAVGKFSNLQYFSICDCFPEDKYLPNFFESLCAPGALRNCRHLDLGGMFLSPKSMEVFYECMEKALPPTAQHNTTSTKGQKITEDYPFSNLESIYIGGWTNIGDGVTDSEFDSSIYDRICRLLDARNINNISSCCSKDDFLS